MPTIKKLGVKFAEEGLNLLKQQVDSSMSRIGNRLDEVVRKARETAAEIAKVQSAGSGSVQGIDIKDTQGINQLIEQQAKRLQSAVSRAFRTLGVDSAQHLERLRDQAIAAFNAIRTSGIASAEDIAKAQRALSGKLLNLDQVTQAFRRLNVQSTQQLEQMRQQAIADFEAIKASGRSTADDIRNAQRSLNQKLIDLDPVIGAFRQLGIQSSRSVDLLRRNAIEAFRQIRQSGVSSAEDVQRAQAALSQTLVNLDPVVQAFRDLGVKSTRELDNLERNARRAFERIEQSGKESEQGIARARAALSKQLSEIAKQRAVPAVDVDPVVEAFKELRIKSGAELDQMEKRARDAFERISQDAQASAQDQLRAQQALNERLAEIDKLRTVVPAPETDAVEQAFKDLNVQSSRELENLRRKAQQAFDQIRNSGVSSAEDVRRAQQALNERLVNLSPVAAAFKELGVQSRAELQALRDRAISAFQAIRDSGTATPQDVTRAWLAMRRQISKLDPVEAAFRRLGVNSRKEIQRLRREAVEAFNAIKAAGRGVGDVDLARAGLALEGIEVDLDPVTKAFRDLGSKSSRELQHLANIAKASFEAIKASGVSSATDIARAQELLNQQLAQLGSTAPQIQELERLRDAWQTLGLTSREQLELMANQARGAFERIVASGVAAPAEIQAAWFAMQQRVGAAQNFDGMRNAFRELRIQSTAELERLRAQAIAAFEAIRRAGGDSARDTARAQQALIKRLHELDLAFKQVGRSARSQRTIFRRTTAFLASLAFETTGAVFALGAVATAILAPFKVIGDARGQLERLEFSLRELNDTAEQTERDLAFLRDFGLGGRQPFDFDTLIAGFQRLKGAGIEPAAGAMETLVDAITATKGVDPQAFERASTAISQIASKGVAQAEEMRQQLAEALPGALKIAADALDISLKEMNERMEAGTLTAREFLTALFEELEERFDGAAERSLQSWDGLFKRLSQAISRFKLQVADAGLFDAMKEALEDLVATFDKWANDGTAEKLAEQWANVLQTVLSAFRTFVEVIAEYGDTIISTLRLVVEAFIASKIIGFVARLVGGVGSLITVFKTAKLAGAGLAATLTNLGRIGLAAAGPVGWLALLATGLFELTRRARESLAENQKLQRFFEQNKLDQSGESLSAQEQFLRGRIEVIDDALDRYLTTLDKFKDSIGDEVSEVEQRTLDGFRNAISKLDRDRLKATDQLEALLKKREARTSRFDGDDPRSSFGGLIGADGEDDGGDSKKALNDARERAQARIALTRDALQREKRLIDEQLQDIEISRRESIDRQLAATRKAVTEEIAIKRELLTVETDDGKRAKLAADIAALELDLQEAEDNARRLTERATRQVQDNVIDLQARLLEMSGKAGEAAALRLDAEFREALARAQQAKSYAEEIGNFAAAEQAQVRIDLIVELKGKEQAIAEFEDLQRQVENILSDQARKEQNITVQLETGLIGEIEARRQLNEVHRQTASTLETVLPKLEALAEASSSEELKQYVADLKAQLYELQNQVDQTSLRIRDSVREGLTDLFDDMLEGAKSASEAFRDFGKAVLATMRRILAEKFAEKLIKQLGIGKGLDAAFGFIFGKSSGGSVQAKASGGEIEDHKKRRRSRTTRRFIVAIEDLERRARGGSVGASAGAQSPVQRFDSGGMIRGPGTGTSDSIRTAMPAGTYILRAAAVRKYGPRTLDAVRQISDSARSFSTRARQALGVRTRPGTPPGARRAVPVAVSNGEYRIEPQVVNRLGRGFFEALNRMQVPAERVREFLSETATHGFAEGGLLERMNGVTVFRPHFATGGIAPSPTASGDPLPQGPQVPSALQVLLSDSALNMTMRDWLERELATIAAGR